MTEPVEVTIARIDEGVKHLTKTLDSHVEVSDKRLDAHAKDLKSLNTTRDRYRGGIKILAGLGAICTGVVGWLLK